MKCDITTRKGLHWLEWAVSAFGTLNCLVIALLFAQSQPDVFPLPGLYLIEIGSLGLAPLVALLYEGAKWRPWPDVAWAVAGVLLTFAVLGMWTIGLFLVPALFSFVLAALLGSRRQGKPAGRGVRQLAMATLVQAAWMLLLIVAG
jgi:hypothetical protein